jgi:signal transduction histidine kinase/CHASE3 domain sensor protein
MPDRRRRNRLTRRLAVFGPAVIVVLTGVLSYAALRRELVLRDLVLHTHDVMDASSDLLTALLTAETAQRGYLLTHDSAYLVPYNGAPQQVDRALRRLQGLTRDNVAQQSRLDTLRIRVTRRLTVLDSTIGAERQGRTDLAKGIMTHGPGQSLMSEIRRRVDSVDAEEERLLAVRRAAETRSTEVTATVPVLGTFLAGLLAFLVNRNLDRALRDRRKALSESQTALRAAEESERRAERLQAATEAFTGALSMAEVSELIVDQTMNALGAHSGGLAVVDGDQLRFVALRNIDASRVGATVPVHAGLPLAAAVRQAEPVIVENAEDMQRRFPDVRGVHERDGIQAVAAFPLIADSTVMGALLIRFAAPRPFSPGDRAFMSAMSRIATETFERARLFDAERNARAAAEAANRAKATFLASMSHELRTPLNAALGFASLVRSGVYGAVNEQQSEVLSRVERSQTHLAHLIDDILDFARLEAGRVRVKLEPVRVLDVISDLAPLVEPQATAKKIELSLLPPQESLRVSADRQRLQQILVNLVGNAIKFTPELGTIRVGARAVDEKVVIQVQDTGVGIPADRLQSIFEPFVQVDAGLTRTVAGAGLGLAISRDLARAMGGDLTVESELGKGSTFSVTLPALSASPTAVASTNV